MPSSARPAWPNGLALGRGWPFFAAGFATGFLALNLTTLADFFAAVFFTAGFAFPLAFWLAFLRGAIVSLPIPLMPVTAGDDFPIKQISRRFAAISFSPACSAG